MTCQGSSSDQSASLGRKSQEREVPGRDAGAGDALCSVFVGVGWLVLKTDPVLCVDENNLVG